jgi:hypothetical protein
VQPVLEQNSGEIRGAPVVKHAKAKIDIFAENSIRITPAG